MYLPSSSSVISGKQGLRRNAFLVCGMGEGIILYPAGMCRAVLLLRVQCYQTEPPWIPMFCNIMRTC